VAVLTRADMDALLARADRIIADARRTSASVGAKRHASTADDPQVIDKAINPPKRTKRG